MHIARWNIRTVKIIATDIWAHFKCNMTKEANYFQLNNEVFSLNIVSSLNYISIFLEAVVTMTWQN